MTPWDELEAGRDAERHRREAVRVTALIDQLHAKDRERISREMAELVRCGFRVDELCAFPNESGTALIVMPAVVMGEGGTMPERFEGDGSGEFCPCLIRKSWRRRRRR